MKFRSILILGAVGYAGYCIGRNTKHVPLLGKSSLNRIIDLLKEELSVASPSKKWHKVSQKHPNGVVVYSRGHAERILADLQRRCENFGCVSRAYFLQSIGIRSEYEDNLCGWTNLDAAVICKVYTGYLLRLPIPELLD